MAGASPDIFLSYAREDEGRARELARALEKDGFAVFWAPDIPPGQTWHSHIGEALENAKCVVVAWSRHSIKSKWVLEEAGEGNGRNALVPVLFDAVQPPLGFRQIQAANLVEWRSGRPSPDFDALLNAIRRVVGGSPPGGAEQVVREEIPRQPTPEAPRTSSPHPAARSYRPWILGSLLAIVAAGGIGAYQFLAPREEAPRPEVAEPAAPPAQSPETETEVEPAAPPVATAEPEPGDEMRDCAECPEMVLVPAGEFTMGSPPDEPGRLDSEGPQHQVTIAAPLWVGKYEVTFDEWDACVADGGCKHTPKDQGWGRGNRPVIYVSWDDAQQYAAWLSEKTGVTYRLLSEAEWEYVARAGSTTAYWWGPDVGRDKANCSNCGSEWDNTKTAPVGSFAANNFGLHDTAGNVWEWVEDCPSDRYDGAPTYEEGDCSWRVQRGGSWRGWPPSVRSAQRSKDGPHSRDNAIGFRVARTLD